MKTYTATDARNRFGEFLDAGMVEGVKVVRNNRVLGYFVPERQYEEWAQFATLASMPSKKSGEKLKHDQIETLNAYCAGEITASEARAGLACDRRALIELVAMQGLTLPHVSPSQAVEMAHQALGSTDIERKLKSKVKRDPLGTPSEIGRAHV